MYHRATLIALGIAVIFAVHSTWALYKKQRESDDQKRIAQEKVTELVAREEQLQSDIGALQTGYGVEQEIRAKFNVARPDENVAIVVDSDSSLKTTTASTTSIWQKILNIFH